MRKILALVSMVALATACKKDKKEEPAAPATASGTATPAPEAKAPEATPPAGSGLTLTHKAPAVGDKREESDALTTEFTITPPGKSPIPMKMTKEETRHVEVLAVDASGPTKVKVHYAVKKEASDMGPGGKKDEVSPLQGKAYVVWAEGDTVKATADGGGAISKEEEAELVSDWQGDLGEEDAMAKVFRDKRWTIDEKVTLTPDQLALLNRKNKDTSAKSGTITLTAVDGNVATFAIEMDVEQREKEGTLSMPMKLTVKVDTTTSWPQELAMTGTIAGQMQGMDAKGTLSGRKTYKY